MVSFGRKSSVAEAGPEVEQPGEASLAEATTQATRGAFPSVNLIPDQIAAEAKVRTAKIVWGAALGGSVALVAGLYLVAASGVSSAQDQLDGARAQSANLASEAARYSDVPKVRSDLQAAQAQQLLALGGEVRWSTVLNNLGLTIPPGVSLVSFQATVNGTSPSAAATGTNAVPSVTSVLGNPGIGTVQYQGEALDDARLAAFLESVAKNPGLIDPFATQAAASASSNAGTASTTPKSITFSASATISNKALSHRFDAKGN